MMTKWKRLSPRSILRGHTPRVITSGVCAADSRYPLPGKFRACSFPSIQIILGLKGGSNLTSRCGFSMVPFGRCHQTLRRLKLFSAEQRIDRASRKTLPSAGVVRLASWPAGILRAKSRGVSKERRLEEWAEGPVRVRRERRRRSRAAGAGKVLFFEAARARARVLHLVNSVSERRSNSQPQPLLGRDRRSLFRGRFRRPGDQFEWKRLHRSVQERSNGGVPGNVLPFRAKREGRKASDGRTRSVENMSSVQVYQFDEAQRIKDGLLLFTKTLRKAFPHSALGVMRNGWSSPKGEWEGSWLCSEALEVKNFFRSKLSSSAQYEIFTWFNILENGGSIGSHDHYLAEWVGVYHIEGPGDLVCDTNQGVEWVPAIEGRLAIFKGDVKHAVPGPVRQPRISLTMNAHDKGKKRVAR